MVLIADRAGVDGSGGTGAGLTPAALLFGVDLSPVPAFQGEHPESRLLAFRHWRWACRRRVSMVWSARSKLFRPNSRKGPEWHSIGSAQEVDSVVDWPARQGSIAWYAPTRRPPTPESDTIHRVGGRGATLGMVLAFSMVIAACGSSKAGKASGTVAASTTPSVTSSIPPGYVEFRSGVNHFRISVPSNWRQIDPSSPGAAAVVQDVEKSNPALKTVLGAGDLASKGITFFAISPDGKVNLNIVVKPAVGARDSDLPSLRTELKTQYQQLGGNVTSTETVSLAGHQALQIHVQLPLKDASGTTHTLNETQDVLAANDFAYILTFTGEAPDVATIAATFNVS